MQTDRRRVVAASCATSTTRSRPGSWPRRDNRNRACLPGRRRRTTRRRPLPLQERTSPHEQESYLQDPWLDFTKGLLGLEGREKRTSEWVEERRAGQGDFQFFADHIQKGIFFTAKPFQVGDQCGPFDPFNDRI